MCHTSITPETGLIMVFKGDVRQFMCFPCLIKLMEAIEDEDFD